MPWKRKDLYLREKGWGSPEVSVRTSPHPCPVEYSYWWWFDFDSSKLYPDII